MEREGRLSLHHRPLVPAPVLASFSPIEALAQIVFTAREEHKIELRDHANVQ